MLASRLMVSNSASVTLGGTADAAPADEHAVILERLDGRSLVLVGLMGAGKTTIGRRLAGRLGLPFVDADSEIERAAGCSVAEIFARYGEAEFRLGEGRVIGRLLAERQAVVATGGGAVTDAQTRRLIGAKSVSVWLRCPLAVLHRRVSRRGHRPLLRAGDAMTTLERLQGERGHFYAEADLTIDCGDDSPDQTASRVLDALAASREMRRLRVPLGRRDYDVLIGDGLLGRAGGLLRRVLPAGEGSKRLDVCGGVVDDILAGGIERGTAILALGGGVIGDLAGFAAATLLRGLPLVQLPTTLLAQVDSSVGGKVGINTAAGKNLLGAFHQPIAVLADTLTLATLPPRELRAGYAEIVKAGLIADPALFCWCECNGRALVEGAPALLADAVERACAFKAAIVAEDEREERADGGRALLNLGHTFGHALEAALGFDGRLLHGEAVAIGCALAFRLSASLGLCSESDGARVVRHLDHVGLPARIADLGVTLGAEALLAHMGRDKKMRDGRLGFILAAGIGQAMVVRSVPAASVRALLRDEGCAP